MKLFFMIMVVASLCRYSLAVPEAKVSLEVIDENGVRLEDCDVAVVFEIDGKEVWESGKSKTNTHFSVTKNIGHPYVTAVAKKNGYYISSHTYMFKGMNADRTKLEPWNPVITLVLRKIIDPQKGKQIARGKGKPKDFPVYDQEIGFDMIMGDWVAPYGKGVMTDFKFLVSVDKQSKVAYYTVEFQNVGDGIQEYAFTSIANASRFKGPHQAPLEGYKTSLKKKHIWGGDKTRLPDFEEFPDYATNRKESLNYIFRIRTQYDEKGNIKSAYYGRINGDIIDLRYNKREMLNYWINTDPISRSLESIALVVAENKAETGSGSGLNIQHEKEKEKGAGRRGRK